MYAISRITGQIGRGNRTLLLAAEQPVRAAVRDVSKGKVGRITGAKWRSLRLRDAAALTEAFRDRGSAALRAGNGASGASRLSVHDWAQAIEPNILSQHTIIEKACCPIIPPRDKPTTMIAFKPRARQKATQCCVISATVSGVSPPTLRHLHYQRELPHRPQRVGW